MKLSGNLSRLFTTATTTLALCVLMLHTRLTAHEINIDALAESAGSALTYNGTATWVFELSKKQVAKVNDARKLSIRPRLSAEKVNGLPWVNREYVVDYLTILEAELNDAKKPASKSALFTAMVGKDSTKWRLYVALEAKYAVIPPPLPNVSQNMPTRRGEGR